MSGSSWNALQVAEGLRAIDGILASAVTLVEALEPESMRELEPRISSDDIRELKRWCELLAELAGHASQLAERLPDEGLSVDGEELSESAAEDLGDGIIDPDRARLAARVLSVDVGWRAFARSLRGGDTQLSWDDLTVGELLGSFRGATEPAVLRVLSSAGVPAGLDFASCGEEDLCRLAAALEQNAGAQ